MIGENTLVVIVMQSLLHDCLVRATWLVDASVAHFVESFPRGTPGGLGALCPVLREYIKSVSGVCSVPFKFLLFLLFALQTVVRGEL